MIDARRMEFFTALFDRNLNALIKPHNRVLTETDFSDVLQKGKIVFFGNGSDKFRQLLSHPNAIFKKLEVSAGQMVGLAYHQFNEKKFADLAYCEPFYSKEFFSST